MSACLRDKVVVITGASSGIGKATAKAFARKGSKLVLAARRLSKLKSLEQELGVECASVQTDVSKERDVQRLFRIAERKFGRVDILVNNAGALLIANVEETSMEEWNSVIGSNLTGVFLCTREAVRIMKRKKIKGHIINVSSIAGLIAVPRDSAYCAAKHGVTAFTWCLKLELKRYGIKASAIYPGPVDTDLFGSLIRWNKRWMLSPDDIADKIVAVASRSILQSGLVTIINLFKRILKITGLISVKNR